MKTKEVEINWEGKPAKVVLKKLTWGEYNAVLRESMSKLRMTSFESAVLELDVILFREILLLKSIVSAPFPKTLDAIRNLECEDGERLFEAANELNPFFQLAGRGAEKVSGERESTAGNDQ